MTIQWNYSCSTQDQRHGQRAQGRLLPRPSLSQYLQALPGALGIGTWPILTQASPLIKAPAETGNAERDKDVEFLRGRWSTWIDRVLSEGQLSCAMVSRAQGSHHEVRLGKMECAPLAGCRKHLSIGQFYLNGLQQYGLANFLFPIPIRALPTQVGRRLLAALPSVDRFQD